MKSSHQEIANVIEIHRGKPMVSSLKIAELFDRPHFRVLKSLKSLIGRGTLTTGVEVSSWIDSTGRSNDLYWLDERSSLIAMPFIGGAKAEEGQARLVDAYLFYRDHFRDPPRHDLLAAKRAAHHPMMDALVEFRAEAGKDTEAKHYMCENKLCNWAVTGKFHAIDEKSLSNEEAVLLEKVRVQNRAMLDAGQSYDERKPKLFEFAMRKRNKKPLPDGL